MSATSIENSIELDTKKLGKEKKSKVQFDLTPETEQELDELQRLSGSTTRVELIRRALLFYGWFIHDVEPDATLQVVRGDKVLMSFPASLLKGTKKPS